MPGDIVFIVGGVLPFLWMAFQGWRFRNRGKTVDELPVESLFTVPGPAGNDPSPADGAEHATTEGPRS
jgi:nitric oxide reductase subunit B